MYAARPKEKTVTLVMASYTNMAGPVEAVMQHVKASRRLCRIGNVNGDLYDAGGGRHFASAGLVEDWLTD